MPMDQQCSWNIQYILASAWPQQSMTTHLPHLRIAEDHIFLQNQASRRELLQCRKETNNGDDGDCGSYKAFIYLRYLRTDFLPRNRRLSSRHLRHSKTNFCLFGCQRNNTINVHRKHRKKLSPKAAVVVQLKELPFPTPENPASNPVMGNFIQHLFTAVWTLKNIKKKGEKMKRELKNILSAEFVIVVSCHNRQLLIRYNGIQI